MAAEAFSGIFAIRISAVVRSRVVVFSHRVLLRLVSVWFFFCEKCCLFELVYFEPPFARSVPKFADNLILYMHLSQPGYVHSHQVR